MAEKKEKQYVSDNAQLMAEWDWEKNRRLGLTPQKLTCGSGKKVWWKCNKGHEWQAIICDINQGRGCPYCAGKRVLKGFNDLATINSNLANEWNHERNGKLTPELYTANSNKSVWWKCSKGHEWQATISNRNGGTGCPYCSNNKVLTGFNDLQTSNSMLSDEWNYERNENLKPSFFSVNSGKKVWWKCSKGHEWQATIESRNKGAGCPYCAGKKALKGYNDLQTVNPVLAKEWNYNKNGNLKPEDFMVNSHKKVWWKCQKGHEWQASIVNRNKGTGCPVCASERNTSFPEYAFLFYLKKFGLNPVHSYKENGYELDIYIPLRKIAIEYDGYYWHKNKRKQDLEKNHKCKIDGIKLYRVREGLLPLGSGSIDYVIRKDKKDLSEGIRAVLRNILENEVDVDIDRDFIDIETLREYSEKDASLMLLNQLLAKEWNFEKNGRLKPDNYTVSSGKKVWWKCNKEHEWQATIASRNKGNGCPYCSNKKVLKGYNDLQTVNLALSKEWNYAKNNNLKPEDFIVNSHKKVWWKCQKGHEWQASIVNRNKGTGCPYCSGRYAIKGKNDLQTTNPELAGEWNYERNNGLTPAEIMSKSSQKVWWSCSNCGTAYSTSVYNRTRGFLCPSCRKNTAKMQDSGK